MALLCLSLLCSTTILSPDRMSGYYGVFDTPRWNMHFGGSIQFNDRGAFGSISHGPIHIVGMRLSSEASKSKEDTRRRQHLPLS